MSGQSLTVCPPRGGGRACGVRWLGMAHASLRLSQFVCTVRDDTARFVSGSLSEREVRQNCRMACLWRGEQASERGG